MTKERKRKIVRLALSDASASLCVAAEIDDPDLIGFIGSVERLIKELRDTMEFVVVG